MRYFQLLFLLMGFVYAGSAQETFTYMSDRMFNDPSELIGYNFKPSSMERVGDKERNIRPDEYSFGISRNNLYVGGKGIGGVYSVNNINPTEYGYKLLLMNARDPTIQGHLKIILTKESYVEALVFKRSNKDKEIIFFISEMPKRLWDKEKEYFTDRWETTVEAPDSLWGKSVRPFYRVHNDGNRVQERLEMKDSTLITFTKTVRIIEKIKKKKKKKKKKKEEAVAVSNVEGEAEEAEEESTDEEQEGMASAELGEGEMTTPPDSLGDEDVKKKIKIITEYFIDVRSILRYNDGGVEDKTWTYQIKGLKERKDDLAGPNEEKYQIEATATKGPPIYIYLLPDRTISSIEVNGQTYRMQGF